VVFQSFGLTNQSNDQIVASYEKLAESCDQFIAFELGRVFAFGSLRYSDFPGPVPSRVLMTGPFGS